MKLQRNIICFAAILFSATLSAQPPFDEGVDDVPAAAIPGIALVIAVGLAFGFKAVRTNKD
ncbi:hypothetical protein [Nonlabens marinus]|nr:hypothetical protein [Nonlabens marinus]